MTRFYPEGRRTYYTQTRGADYGLGIKEKDWVRRANRELLLIGMIENLDLVENLEEVLAVEGIDAFHIGPLDLAQSMGYPPPSELEQVIADVIRRCRAAGKHVAVGVVTPWSLEALGPRIAQGVQLFSVASAWLLTHAVSDFFNQVNTHIPPGRRNGPLAPAIEPNPYLAGPGSRD